MPEHLKIHGKEQTTMASGSASAHSFPSWKHRIFHICEDAAATYRTIVKGNLETSVDYDKAPKDILDSFSKSYNQMQL